MTLTVLRRITARRFTALGLCLALLTGCALTACAGPGANPSPAVEDASPATPGVTVSLDEAKTAFGILGQLNDAWKKRDCDKVAFLTTGAKGEASGRACAATRHGRRPPESFAYGAAEFYLPARDGDWFVALARKPKPAYFLFQRDDDRWRLAAGPYPLRGKTPALTADSPVPAISADTEADDSEEGIAARLVPQRHLAFLTDPAGVNGVRFANGDPVRDLLTELVREPARVRPDRLTVDVRLADVPIHALRLTDGTSLVFHAVEIEFDQRTLAKRLAHPLYGVSDLRAFTGKAHPTSIAGTEIVSLVTQVGAGNKLTTIAMSRALADLTARAP